MNWKTIGCSVRGTSHLKDGLPCQDFCLFFEGGPTEDKLLFIGIADGAGSAALSEVGAQKAVNFYLNLAKGFDWLNGDFNKEKATEWLALTRAHILEYAKSEEMEGGEFASTLLVAVLTKNKSYFIQVGDGCWVVQQDNEYIPATWPCQGEYLNYTKFVTSEDACEHLQFKVVDESISGVAGFTDGLQMLALGFSQQKAHKPFFDLFFNPLQSTDDASSLQAPLISFLDSPTINERTDDDKTLVVACPALP